MGKTGGNDGGDRTYPPNQTGGVGRQQQQKDQLSRLVRKNGGEDRRGKQVGTTVGIGRIPQTKQGGVSRQQQQKDQLSRLVRKNGGEYWWEDSWERTLGSDVSPHQTGGNG